MKFNPEGQLYQMTTTVAQFICLNVLYIILCIPVVTIGWAPSALFEVCLPYADHEKGYLLKDFFKALRKNFRQPTLGFLALAVPILLLFYSGNFWLHLGSIMNLIIGIVSFFLCAYFVLALIYFCALQGRFNTTLKQSLKNALLLPIAHPVRSMGLLLIPALIFCFLVLFPFLQFSIFIFVFSFSAYCSSFLLLSIFKQVG